MTRIHLVSQNRVYSSVSITDRRDYLEFRKDLDWSCDACGAMTHLIIDFDSYTEIIRGLLCSTCKRLLHNTFNDVRENIFRMQKYLAKDAIPKQCVVCGANGERLDPRTGEWLCLKDYRFAVGEKAEETAACLLLYLTRTSYKED